MRYLFKRFVIVIFGQLGFSYITLKDGNSNERSMVMMSFLGNRKTLSKVRSLWACMQHKSPCVQKFWHKLTNHHVSNCWGNCIVDLFVCWVCPMHFVKCFVSVLCQCFWFFFWKSPSPANSICKPVFWKLVALASFKKPTHNYIPATSCHWGFVNGGCSFVARPHPSHPLKASHSTVYETARVAQKRTFDEWNFSGCKISVCKMK